MKRLYLNEEKYISYEKITNNDSDNRYLVFLHGLMSDMHGKKSCHIQNFCNFHRLNFLSFDNLGHGASWGNFTEQNISIWFDSFQKIYKRLLLGKKLIIIGSSMGGWISILFALRYPKEVQSLLLLAPAPDFTEHIWYKLNNEQRISLKEEGIIRVKGEDECHQGFDISYNLIQDGRKNLILDQAIIDIDLPVAIIHGLKDKEVDYQQSMQILQKISSNKIFLHYSKNSTHHLSEIEDLNMISSSLLMLLKLS
ncbi:MAG: alpha/beta hydrolase [Rickettsia sp.]|nr:alpha/beta hydrolase [Rickettsia sp.]